MSPIPLVRCSAYMAFARFAVNEQIRLQRDGALALLIETIERNPETFVPANFAHSLIEKMARHTGQSDLGFLVSREARATELGALGLILRNSTTLLTAFRKVLHSFQYYSSGERICLEIDGDVANVFHEYTFSALPGSRFARQNALSLIRDAVRFAAGPEWQPAAVYSPNLPADYDCLETTFEGADVLPNRRYGLAFDIGLLGLPMQFRSRLENESEVDLTEYPADDFEGSFRQVLATMTMVGRTGLDDAAAAIGITPRTIQRRLKKVGSSYHELQSQVRYELARKLLSEPKHRIIDIAYGLGYTDPSNFTRAFRGWTGVSPNQFRRSAFALDVAK